MKYLVILLSLSLFVSGLSFAYGSVSLDRTAYPIPDVDPLELWSTNDVIIDGTVIDKESILDKNGKEIFGYNIKVNEYFKGKQNPTIIYAKQNHVFPHFDLETGDNALFYIRNTSEFGYVIQAHSVNTFGNCDARSLIEITPVLPNEEFPRSMPARSESYFDQCVADYFSYDPDFFGGIVNGISPLKQTQHGIPTDMIRCYDDLVLVHKYDGTPACVTESTKQKLIERGWTTKESDMKCDNNADFDLIRYSESEDVPPQRLVAFLKEGTTGVICLQYISNFYNEGFFDIDENLHQRNSSNEISSNVVLNAIPDKVSLEHGTNVTVAYEIHAKNNSTGIYWINLSQLCDSLPVVVWYDEPRVSEDDIPARTGGYHCPNKVLDVSIVGYSGLELKYHSAKPT